MILREILSPSNMILTFLAVGVFAPVLWMAIDREPPYVIREVSITPKTVEPGQQVVIKFRVRETHAQCSPGVVYREFLAPNAEPKKLWVYDPIVRRTPAVIQNSEFERFAEIPRDAPSGPLVYRGAVCYSCNPLQSWLRWPICIETPSVEMTVVKSEDD